MAGASGFYVDPLKSLTVGQIPANSWDIYQIGNTSLAMAGHSRKSRFTTRITRSGRWNAG